MAEPDKFPVILFGQKLVRSSIASLRLKVVSASKRMPNVTRDRLAFLITIMIFHE